MTPRLEDWQERLNVVLEHSRSMDFSRSQNDCCRFVNRCLLAVTGSDFGRQFLSQYRCTRTAVFALRANSLSWYVDHSLRVESSSIEQAAWGDVVLIPELGDLSSESVGICIGDKVATMALDGFTTVPLLDCLQCWKVGL